MNLRENLREPLEGIRGRIFKAAGWILEWAKGYRALFLAYLAIGVAVFFMLMSQNLVNCIDGLWWNSSFKAGDWERSIGRWLWPVLDKLRFGIVSSPLNSLVTLTLIACGNILLVDLFQVKRRLTAILVGALFIATPLVCDSLSYCYMSVTFGTAYFLSVAAAYCALKMHRSIVAVITGGVLLSCAMGCYQAYLGTTCIVLLVYFMKLIIQNEEGVIIRNTVIKEIGAVAAGGVLYKIMVSLTCVIYDVELASYKGAADTSLKSILINLPQRISEAYKEFFDFFFTSNTQKMIFHLKWVYILAFLIVACILIYILISVFRRNIACGVLLAAAVLVIPLACNAVLLLVTSSNTILMTGGMSLLFPLFLCLLDDFMDRRLVYSVFMLCLTVLLWVNICIVNNDQVAMKEGRTSVVTIAENIITRMADEGYISTDVVVAFVGRPSENSMFVKTAAWNKANDYARFGGDFWRIGSGDYGNNRRSWNGLLVGYCGVQFNFCSDDIYGELISDEVVENMPCFPEEGSICEVDGVVVVKVSDCY